MSIRGIVDSEDHVVELSISLIPTTNIWNGHRPDSRRK
jgi:hypothetical protein